MTYDTEKLLRGMTGIARARLLEQLDSILSEEKTHRILPIDVSGTPEPVVIPKRESEKNNLPPPPPPKQGIVKSLLSTIGISKPKRDEQVQGDAAPPAKPHRAALRVVDGRLQSENGLAQAMFDVENEQSFVVRLQLSGFSKEEVDAQAMPLQTVLMAFGSTDRQQAPVKDGSRFLQKRGEGKPVQEGDEFVRDTHYTLLSGGDESLFRSLDELVGDRCSRLEIKFSSLIKDLGGKNPTVVNVNPLKIVLVRPPAVIYRPPKSTPAPPPATEQRPFSKVHNTLTTNVTLREKQEIARDAKVERVIQLIAFPRYGDPIPANECKDFLGIEATEFVHDHWEIPILSSRALEEGFPSAYAWMAHVLKVENIIGIEIQLDVVEPAAARSSVGIRVYDSQAMPTDAEKEQLVGQLWEPYWRFLTSAAPASTFSVPGVQVRFVERLKGTTFALGEKESSMFIITRPGASWGVALPNPRVKAQELDNLFYPGLTDEKKALLFRKVQMSLVCGVLESPQEEGVWKIWGAGAIN